MQHHPFKAMSIALVHSPLIPPPDPCHQRSTRLSLNVLRSLARAATGFHVRAERLKKMPKSASCLSRRPPPSSETAFNSGAVNGLFLFRGLLSEPFTFYTMYLKCLLGKCQNRFDRAERVQCLRFAQEKKKRKERKKPTQHACFCSYSN